MLILLGSYNDMRWKIINYIPHASPYEPVRVHVGHMEEWEDEAYDKDIDATGGAKGKCKKAHGTGKRKGYTSGKGNPRGMRIDSGDCAQSGTHEAKDSLDKDGKRKTCRNQAHEVAAAGE